MQITAVSQGDQARLKALRTMRAFATGLLILAGVIFVATHGRDGFWGYVNASSEAAMVGAIADWFAVTAIFRHPLGVPIPHTALIPRRKDALAESLEEFVSQNFLTPQTLRERYLDAEVLLRVGHWLSRPEHAERVITEALPMVQRGLRSVDEEVLTEFVDQTLTPRLKQEPISPLAGHLLEAIERDGAHHGLVDIAASELHSWMVSHPGEVAAIIGSRAPWWSPQWVDAKVTGRITGELVAWAEQVRDQPHHQVRLAIDSYLRDLAHGLQNDPVTMAKAEDLKVAVLSHPQVGSTVFALWEAMREAVLEALDDAQGQLRTRLNDEVSGLGAKLREDEALRSRLDSWIADLVVAGVDRYGAEVTSVITSTIRAWDGKLAADRIELHVGRDLQFIRINGTVVGALVGLVIHAISQLLPG